MARYKNKITYAGIGEIVQKQDIKFLNQVLYNIGREMFFHNIYDGAFEEVAYAYIHPCDEMRTTDNFDTIQQAFINAYV